MHALRLPLSAQARRLCAAANPSTAGVPHRIPLPGTQGSLACTVWTPAAHQSPMPSVILAHGGGQTRRSWDETGAFLASRGVKTIAYDHRGHGESAHIEAPQPWG
jgi:pimeloyl-ACP methyl ester carboxylesterase